MNILTYDQLDILLEKLRRRGSGDVSSQQKTVEEIFAQIQERGDAALFEYTHRFDGFAVSAENIAVTQAEIDEAYAQIPEDLLQVIRESAANILDYHQMQKREGFELTRPGVSLRQIIRPVDSAGVYVPGGKAAYPSSVLMNIIPAKVAGVEKIVMVTPVGRDGKVPPLTLVSGKEAGADLILKIGGAQAVCALALGTASVPKVDKITGPGNIYVALAKKLVFGTVGIDMIAGPSEVLVIADDTMDPRIMAADFLSQAEHDEQAACILVALSEEFAQAAAAEIERQAALLPRREIVFQSLKDYGTIIVAKDPAQAAEISNLVAPEHLELCVEEPEALLPLIRHAGSIFLGKNTPEPLGDYFAGANHVLPTNGTARFSSPLSVDDFIKKSSVLCYSEEAFERVYQKVKRFAEAEGLDAHARSAAIRFEK